MALSNRVCYRVLGAALAFAVCTLHCPRNALADSKSAEAMVRRGFLTVHFEFRPDESLPVWEKEAGSKDALIDILLKMRLDPNSPFLPIRAEQALIEYAKEQRVQEALFEDFQHPGRKGLATVIRRNMNRLPEDFQILLNSVGQAK